MRGSVTKFDKKRLRGRILGEDDREVLFDKASLDGLNTRLLSVGDWVEFREQYSGGGPRAINVRFTLCFTGAFLGERQAIKKSGETNHGQARTEEQKCALRSRK
jgi:cold shock CspA family protein